MNKVTECPNCGRSFSNSSTRCDLINGCMDDIRPPLQLPRVGELAGTSDQSAINAMFPPDHPYWQQLKPRDPRSPSLKFHNSYCNDDWDRYHGAGPRGMGPAGDGCVCSLVPEGSGVHPAAERIINDIAIAESEAEAWARGSLSGGPRLWDTPPDTVVHVAGMTMVMFGLFMRQRCEWCGVILIEYDLRRVAVPIGQDPMPSGWPTGQLVRVDGHMSAVIEDPEVIDGDIKLPMDSCAFDPATQIGTKR